MDARGTHQLGDGLGEEVVVPTNGSSGGRRGTEVEVGQCLAVRERPQEQLLREFLLLRRRRRHRGGGKEEEKEEGQEEDRSSAGRIHQYGEVPAGENPLSLMAGCPLLCAAMDGFFSFFDRRR